MMIFIGVYRSEAKLCWATFLEQKIFCVLAGVIDDLKLGLIDQAWQVSKIV